MPIHIDHLFRKGFPRLLTNRELLLDIVVSVSEDYYERSYDECVRIFVMKRSTGRAAIFEDSRYDPNHTLLGGFGFGYVPQANLVRAVGIVMLHGTNLFGLKPTLKQLQSDELSELEADLLRACCPEDLVRGPVGRYLLRLDDSELAAVHTMFGGFTHPVLCDAVHELHYKTYLDSDALFFEQVHDRYGSPSSPEYFQRIIDELKPERNGKERMELRPEDPDRAKCPYCGIFADDRDCEHSVAYWEDDSFASEDEGFLHHRIYGALSDLGDAIGKLNDLLKTRFEGEFELFAKELSKRGLDRPAAEIVSYEKLYLWSFGDVAYEVFGACGEQRYNEPAGGAVGMVFSSTHFYTDDIDAFAKCIKDGFAPTVKVLEEIAAHFEQLRPSSKDD